MRDIYVPGEKNELAGVIYVDQYEPPRQTDLQSKGNATVVTAVFCAEIGGSNSMEPLIYGAYNNMPVVDCDEMGRAFPELQVCCYSN